MSRRFGRIDKTFFTFRHVHKSSSTKSFAKGCLTKPLDLSISESRGYWWSSQVGSDPLEMEMRLLHRQRNKHYAHWSNSLAFLDLQCLFIRKNQRTIIIFFSVVYTLSVSVFFSSENSFSLKSWYWPYPNTHIQTENREKKSSGEMLFRIHSYSRQLR